LKATTSPFFEWRMEGGIWSVCLVNNLFRQKLS
jgi:hypothetical protein